MNTPTTHTVTTSPLLIASAYLALVVVTNTGTKPVRVVTTGPDNGRVIAAGASAELEHSQRWSNLYLAADSPSTVEVGRYSVEDLRRDAAAHYNVPAFLLRGTTKAEIAASVADIYGGPDA